jgi:hypothetical protein
MYPVFVERNQESQIVVKDILGAKNLVQSYLTVEIIPVMHNNVISIDLFYILF